MRILVITVTQLFHLIPERIALSFGLFFGWILHRIVRFRYNIIRKQLDVAYGKTMTKNEIQRLIKKVYRHLGLMVIEILRLPGISQKEVTRKIIFHGDDIAKKAIAKGKGVIVLTGHIGNWEMVGPAWSQKGYRLYAIGKEMKSHIGNVFIKLIRDDNGVTTIPRRNSLKDIIQLLAKNEVIVVMIDQNMKASEGVFVDFFGQQACTLPGLAVLAARTDAAILPIYCYRDDDLKHHHTVVLPEVEYEHKYDKARANIIHNTARFSKVLESIISEHPEQWLWIHKRWKTRPPKEGSSPINC